MYNRIVDKFTNECTTYLNTQLSTHLLNFPSTNEQTSTIAEYYLNEYQRCINEQNHFINYIKEELTSLDALKSSEIACEKFIERLKSIHEYELKQNEIFEQILHELTNTNPSSKEERIRLLEQIDELIACKAQLSSTNNKLLTKSSDTFKNIL